MASKKKSGPKGARKGKASQQVASYETYPPVIPRNETPPPARSAAKRLADLFAVPERVERTPLAQVGERVLETLLQLHMHNAGVVQVVMSNRSLLRDIIGLTVGEAAELLSPAAARPPAARADRFRADGTDLIVRYVSDRGEPKDDYFASVCTYGTLDHDVALAARIARLLNEDDARGGA